MINIQHKHTLKGHQGAIYKLAINESASSLFSAGGDGWIVSWDLNRMEDDGVLIAKSDAQLFSIGLIENQNLLIGGCMNGDLLWIDTNSNTIIKKHNLSSYAIYDILVTDEYFYTCGADGYLTQWDPLRMNPILSIAVSSKALRRCIYDPIKHTFYVASSDGTIYAVGKDFTKSQILIPNAHQPSVFCLYLFNDQLLSGGRDAKINLWDLKHLSLNKTIDAHWFTVNDLIALPDQNKLVSASRDKSMRLWDPDSMKPILTINNTNTGHSHSVNSLAYSIKYNFLLSASDDRTIRVYQIL